MSAVIIPARFASSRFRGKMLADIGGEPMIVRVAKKCMQSKADNVVVVTDNEQVFNACLKVDGLQVLMSPQELATGTDRVAYAATSVADDIIINVQGDEPFIPPTLINSLIDGLEADRSVKIITAAVAFPDEASAQNPSAVKVVMDKDDFALYFSRYPIPFNRDGITDIERYRHIGIYGFRRWYLFEFAETARTPLEKAENLEQLRALESGMKIKVVKTDYSPVSVDTPEDLEKALLYLKRDK